MLRYLPAPIAGVTGFLLFLANLAFWGTLLMLVVGLRLVTWPLDRGRAITARLAERIAENWSVVNNVLMRVALGVRWDVRQAGPALSRHASYVVIANHQSWIDIPVLLFPLVRRIPFPRFFLKQELVWVPIIGQAAWALEMPFMKRYSRATLERHPELRGQDLATARAACERFGIRPVTVINYIEGTRFTHAKHARQGSPYRHLLRPKTGGLACGLNALGRKAGLLLDMTLIYPDSSPSFWKLLSARIPRIVIDIDVVPIDTALFGDYVADPAYRARFQNWINARWARKDALIARERGHA